MRKWRDSSPVLRPLPGQMQSVCFLKDESREDFAELASGSVLQISASARDNLDTIAVLEVGE